MPSRSCNQNPLSPSLGLQSKKMTTFWKQLKLHPLSTSRVSQAPKQGRSCNSQLQPLKLDLITASYGKDKLLLLEPLVRLALLDSLELLAALAWPLLRLLRLITILFRMASRLVQLSMHLCQRRLGLRLQLDRPLLNIRLFHFPLRQHIWVHRLFSTLRWLMRHGQLTALKTRYV